MLAYLVTGAIVHRHMSSWTHLCSLISISAVTVHLLQLTTDTIIHIKGHTHVQEAPVWPNICRCLDLSDNHSANFIRLCCRSISLVSVNEPEQRKQDIERTLV